MSMKRIFAIAAIVAFVAMIGALVLAAGPWRLLLIGLAGISGLVMSLARVIAFDTPSTRVQRTIAILYEVAFWLGLIGLALFSLTR